MILALIEMTEQSETWDLFYLIMLKKVIATWALYHHERRKLNHTDLIGFLLMTRLRLLLNIVTLFNWTKLFCQDTVCFLSHPCLVCPLLVHRTTEQQQRFHEICGNLVKTQRRVVGWWKRLCALKEEKPKMVNDLSPHRGTESHQKLFFTYCRLGL